MAEALLEEKAKRMPPTPSRSAVIGEHFEHGVQLAKKIGRTSSDAAEEWMEDNIQRIRRHPTEAIVGAFAVGILAGGLLNWLLRRR